MLWAPGHTNIPILNFSLPLPIKLAIFSSNHLFTDYTWKQCSGDSEFQTLKTACFVMQFRFSFEIIKILNRLNHVLITKFVARLRLAFSCFKVKFISSTPRINWDCKLSYKQITANAAMSNEHATNEIQFFYCPKLDVMGCLQCILSHISFECWNKLEKMYLLLAKTQLADNLFWHNYVFMFMNREYCVLCFVLCTSIRDSIIIWTTVWDSRWKSDASNERTNNVKMVEWEREREKMCRKVILHHLALIVYPWLCVRFVLSASV